MRIEVRHVKARLHQLNEMMVQRDSRWRFDVYATSGTNLLVRVRASDGAQVNDIIAGTKSEIARYISAMCTGIWAAEEK